MIKDNEEFATNLREHTVIVWSLEEYVSTYRETVPFKAKVLEYYDGPDSYPIKLVRVRSLVTNTEYHINQCYLLESLAIEQIADIIDKNHLPEY